jgi:26S proteasome regulatory subunit N3
MSEVNKNDQVQAMDIVEEDEETKQKRLVKETMNGKIIFFFFL